MKTRLWTMTMVATCIAGCATNSQPVSEPSGEQSSAAPIAHAAPQTFVPAATRGHETSRQMKSALERNVPIGSSIEDARLYMKSEGFSCELHANSSFVDASGEDDETVHEDIDYVWCDRHDSMGAFVSRRWQCALVIKNDNVASILVSTGLTGL